MSNNGNPWKDLYNIAGVAAFITALIIPISIAAFFIWPPFPDDIFGVIQASRLAGLMSLDFLYLLGNVFAIPVLLVLYITLRRSNESLSLLALVLGLIGLIALIQARPVIEVMALSDQYAAATSEAERTIIMAAKEAVLAQFRGTAFGAHYILGSLALLIFSFVMLRSTVFSKAAAYVGIVTNVVVFGYYVPVVGVYISLVSVLGYLIWWIMLGLRFFRLAKEPEQAPAG